MSNQTKHRPTGCPVTFGIDAFGDRWSFLIIREMLLRGRKTYSDFLQMDEEIATNILADRLKHLEAEAILTKSRCPEDGRSFIYTLTEKGRDLAPIILEIVVWSGKHDQSPEARRGVLKKIKKNRDGFEAEIRSGKT